MIRGAPTEGMSLGGLLRAFGGKGINIRQLLDNGMYVENDPELEATPMGWGFERIPQGDEAYRFDENMPDSRHLPDRFEDPMYQPDWQYERPIDDFSGIINTLAGRQMALDTTHSKGWGPVEYGPTFTNTGVKQLDTNLEQAMRIVKFLRSLSQEGVSDFVRLGGERK